MNTPPRGANGKNAEPNLLTLLEWQALYGQASGYHHYTEYLKVTGSSYIFGKLVAVDGLPDELVGFELSRGFVDDLLSQIFYPAGIPAWMGPIEIETATGVTSTNIEAAALAYFDQPIRISWDVAPGANASLTPARVSRGTALALAFWPGLLAIREPEPALAAMRELLGTDGETVAFRCHENRDDAYCQLLARFANLVVQYGLFGVVTFPVPPAPPTPPTK